MVLTALVLDVQDSLGLGATAGGLILAAGAVVRRMGPDRPRNG